MAVTSTFFQEYYLSSSETLDDGIIHVTQCQSVKKISYLLLYSKYHSVQTPWPVRVFEKDQRNLRWSRKNFQGLTSQNLFL
jgi:hypothetical protein